MRLAPCLAAALLAAALLPAQAQKAVAPAAAASAPKPAAHVTVIEDDNARIEESHGRNGTVQRVTVRSKIAGARPYEIQLAPAGRDPSQERGNAGRPGWSLLNF